MRKFLLRLLTLTVTVLLPASLEAGTKVFVGNGGPNTDWDISSNWSPSGRPTSTDTAIIQNLSAIGVPYVKIIDNATAAKVVVGSGGELRFNTKMETMTISGDLVIQAGGALTSQDSKNAPLYIGGNFICDGSLNPGTYTMTFNGTGTQTISGSQPVPFTKLTVSNPNGITIDGTNVGVSSTLSPSNLSPTLINDGTFTIGSPLPIQLAGFTATVLTAQSVRLEWQTLSETNNYGFNIERSYDNFQTFETIGFQAGHGTTLQQQSYSYEDAAPGAGVVYYRLKQTDLDGVGHSYSEILVVEPTKTTGVAEGFLPGTFRLEQNYPNPFNPSTMIEYTIAGVRGQGSGASVVRLTVYDVLGKEVATLVNGSQAPGTYSVQWNATGMPSGTYFYRLETATSSDVKKMVLAK